MARAGNVHQESSRLTVDQIFASAVQSGRDELERPSSALLFSGIAGGLTMGLTGLAVALVTSLLGHGPVAQLVAAAVYPIGFIAVIIGRAQLFTENTLYPVVLVLMDSRFIRGTLRLWLFVYAGNWVGSLLFAALATRTSSVRPLLRDVLIGLGINAVDQPFWTVFWSGVVGGWLLALVAWLVSGSHWTTGQAVMTWSLTFVLGLGHFAHCVANSGEILSAVLSGFTPIGDYASWLVAATLGNIAGGVVIVSLINYGQVQPAEVSRKTEISRAG
jgi:formate/nitrite transporter FocA (FNT family)